MPDDTVIAYHSRRAESGKLSSLKKDADYEPNCCLDSEDAFSDTSFSTLSDKKLKNLGDIEKKQSLSGTEDGLMLNFEEDEELPSVENELQELNKVMSEVDDSLRTKILSEVESLIAKYRKCLSNAIQGKKHCQMELEKVQCAQRAKIHKLRETNRHLEEAVHQLQSSHLSVNLTSEHSENSNPRMSVDPPSSLSLDSEKNESSVVTSCESSLQIKASDCVDIATPTDITTEENETLLRCSPSLPKQPPNPETEPLGK